MKEKNIIKQIAWILLPALLILLAVVCAIFLVGEKSREKGTLLKGKALASYGAYYPVRVKPDGGLYLDVARFMQAVDYFSRFPDSRAAGELIYIGQGNSIALQLNDDQKSRYAALLKKPNYAGYRIKTQDDPLRSYKSIVDGIGQTLAGTNVEIVLHDTRNPMKSIVAIQNPITGRRVGDSTTNFGYELIKSYAATEEEGPNYISYALTTKDGRKVKSTTIPLYQDKNLIGFICINIDISQLDGANKDAEATFIKAFTTTSDNEKISEVIENTSRNLLNAETAK
ncbi:PAS domain-containing protein [Herbaspirillum sp. RV1423]|uniref:PAS domain-containing protein n=1 Tax=Herbaspirillum sp. RV1423 TaxID=1443993 RepID=UPI0004B1E963|nr:PAS domain-containing protein [Herbaspirillum sp. RV1423]